MTHPSDPEPTAASYEALALLAEIRSVPLDGRDLAEVVTHLTSCLYDIAEADTVGVLMEFEAGPHLYVRASCDSPLGRNVTRKMLASYCPDVPAESVPVTFLGFQRVAPMGELRTAPRSEAFFSYQNGRARLAVIGLVGLRAGMFGPGVDWKMDRLHEEFVRVLRFLRFRQAAETREAALRENLEQQVAERTKQLVHQERLASLGVLSAGIAHEINNPTAFIRGNAQTLQEMWPLLTAALDGEPVDPARLDLIRKEVPKMMDAMVAGTDRISVIVNGLKAYARKDHGMREWIALEDVVTQARTLTAHVLKHGVTLREEWPAGPPARVYANRQELEQVLVNLFVNAVQAMERRTERHLTITGTWTGPEEFSLAVADTGGGIPTQVLEHIFEPFFTTKDMKNGTGLGLAISRKIIESYDGTIAVESTPGVGTTFTVRLPCRPAEGAADPAAGADDTPMDAALRAAQPNAGVLVVDDEPAALHAATSCLERAGYRVWAARTGELASRLGADHAADLDAIFTDLILPDGDGLALARRLRAAYPAIPIILTSGYCSAEDMARILEEGAFVLLPKPFTAQRCLEAVHEACSAADARRLRA